MNAAAAYQRVPTIRRFIYDVREARFFNPQYEPVIITAALVLWLRLRHYIDRELCVFLEHDLEAAGHDAENGTEDVYCKRCGHVERFQW